MSTKPRIESVLPGQPPDFASVMGHTPNIFEKFFELYGEFWQAGIIPAEIKEMMRIRNARITDCGF